MDYIIIRRWTSDFPVQSRGVSAYLSQTIIAITNKLGFSKSGLINNSIGRRVVVYRMTKKLGKLRPFPEWAEGGEGGKGGKTGMRLQLIVLAQSESSLYGRAPISLDIALETEFMKSVDRITSPPPGLPLALRSRGAATLFR